MSYTFICFLGGVVSLLIVGHKSEDHAKEREHQEAFQALNQLLKNFVVTFARVMFNTQGKQFMFSI